MYRITILNLLLNQMFIHRRIWIIRRKKIS